MPPLASDIWLSNVFGFPCYKADHAPTPAEVNDLTDEIKQKICGRALIYIRVPCMELRTVAACTSAGFTVADVSVTYERPPTSSHTLKSSHAISIRIASSDDLLAAREIAGRCFRFSRFHSDPKLGASYGNKVNWSWMDSYCKAERGEMVQVAESSGRTVGFNAIRRQDKGPHSPRIIDLIGVDPNAQRQGVAQALMDAFISDCCALNAKMRVTTQVSNIPAVNLYERNGFRLVESAFVLHRHLS